MKNKNAMQQLKNIANLTEKWKRRISYSIL